MSDLILWVLLALAVVQSVLIVVLMLRRSGSDAVGGITPDELEARVGKVEAALRDEAERSRREQSAAGMELRQEVAGSVTKLGETLGGRIRDAADAQARSNETFGQTLRTTLADSATKVEQLRGSVEQKLDGFQGLAETHRQELTGAFDTFRGALLSQVNAFGEQQVARFAQADQKDAAQAQALREELARLMETLSGTLVQRVGQLNANTEQAWTRFGEELTKLSGAQGSAMEQLRTTVESSLKSMREDNEKRLENIRQTVDEKLHNTLEQRLGESFKLVSERLESVQKGLGEMQSLASGVGDLKKVLTNVKTRGTWGEVLLGNLLEQVLTSEQYGVNVATTGGSERVEYAIKLPGRGANDTPVWLPIDSKFPKEDYERLLLAQEAGDAELALAAGAALEQSVRRFAQDICDKYIESPKTTDFGIMFLPSEGLYAEVVRRTETVEYLQRKCKVLVTGPTTLAALLNSLQMGFRTLAIQKRSSEVWDLLGAVKTEFGKYADVMAKVQKKLQEASNTIESAEQRTRVINRKLKAVEGLSQDPATETFASKLLLDDEPADAET